MIAFSGNQSASHTWPMWAESAEWRGLRKNIPSLNAPVTLIPRSWTFRTLSMVPASCWLSKYYAGIFSWLTVCHHVAQGQTGRFLSPTFSAGDWVEVARPVVSQRYNARLDFTSLSGNHKAHSRTHTERCFYSNSFWPCGIVLGWLREGSGVEEIGVDCVHTFVCVCLCVSLCMFLCVWGLACTWFRPVSVSQRVYEFGLCHCK